MPSILANRVGVLMATYDTLMGSLESTYAREAKRVEAERRDAGDTMVHRAVLRRGFMDRHLKTKVQPGTRDALLLVIQQQSGGELKVDAPRERLRRAAKYDRTVKLI